jgi:hypothetical protein
MLHHQTPFTQKFILNLSIKNHYSLNIINVYFLMLKNIKEIKKIDMLFVVFASKLNLMRKI